MCYISKPVLNMYYYQIYGFCIGSEIALPELKVSIETDPHVNIIIGKVPIHLASSTAKGVLFESATNDFLFRIPKIASYRVQNGSLITIELSNSINIEETRLYLYGSVFAALLYQKGYIPLHGSSFLSNEKGVSIVGSSSTGKSSIVAELAKREYMILADDISAVKAIDNTTFQLYPGIPYIKLWKDVIDYLGTYTELQKLRPEIEKYKYDIKSSIHSSPIQITKIICLSVKNTNGFELNKIYGIEKFNALRRNLYRQRFIEGMNLSEQYFQYITSLANQVSVYNLRRPSQPLLIKEMADFIEKNII